MVVSQACSFDMNWLSEDQKRQIKQLAAQTPEQEACGFVLPDGSVVAVKNSSPNPAEQFRIEANIVAQHADAVGCWHSHLVLDGFSVLDQIGIAADGAMPWAVYTLATDRFCECDPLAQAPYVGRPYVWGVWDCYSLVADWLAREQQIVLPEWERGQWGEWNTPGFRPFDEEWPKFCKRVSDPMPGDILLFNVGDHAGHTDHVGVMVGTRDFLHHPANKQSRQSRLGGHWLRRLNCAVRVKGPCSS